MKKDSPCELEISHAQTELYRRCSVKALEGLPVVTEEDQRRWLRENRSPRQKSDDIFYAKMEELKKGANALIFAAKMGQLTSDELYQKVLEF